MADELQSSSQETRENPAHHDSQPSLALPRGIRVGVLTPGRGPGPGFRVLPAVTLSPALPSPRGIRVCMTPGWGPVLGSGCCLP